MMDQDKAEFLAQLRKLGTTLTEYVSTNGGDWSIKGFIDVDQNVYTISSDTKIISKILEIQLFPKFGIQIFRSSKNQTLRSSSRSILKLLIAQSDTKISVMASP